MSETLTEEAPANFEELRAAVLERRERLPRRLAQIAAFILDHPDEVAFGTVTEIAQRADVPPSALVRFAQAFGMAGFSELQEIFRSRLRAPWPGYEERLRALKEDEKAGQSPFALLHAFADMSATSIERMCQNVREADLERAVELLAEAETIYVVAQRRSFPVSTYLAYAFGKLGVRSVLVDNLGGMMSEQTAFLSRRDALLTVSFTPYSNATIDLANEAKRRHCPVVAITDSAFSPLAQVATVWFEVAELDVRAFRSLSATFCLAMTLAVGTAERRTLKR